MERRALFYTLVSIHKESDNTIHAHFSNEEGKNLQIIFKSFISLRVYIDKVQRLFFPEVISSQKTRFINEYGIDSGKVSSKIYDGTIGIEQEAFKFRVTGEDPQLELLDFRSAEVLVTVEVSDELLINTNEIRSHHYFLHCLCFAFAWCLIEKIHD